MQRLRELTEEECYLRCYGWVGEDDGVTVIRDEPDRRGSGTAEQSERIRRAFEERLEGRDREAA